MPARRKVFFFFMLLLLAVPLFSSSRVFAATFSFSGAPVSINENESFNISVNLQGLSAGNKYYLRAVFSHPDAPSSYFGYTKNNSGTWYNGKPSPIDYTQFFQIIMGSDNSWSGSIEAKSDLGASEYKGSSIYNFKIGRYTEAGSGPTWADGLAQIMVIAAPTPTITPTPTPNPTPTSTLTPTSTPTTTPTPTPATKATYKINEVKDQGGAVLGSVKIYVDSQYVHHYTPETLTFCDNCECYSGIACGFGDHTVRLEKSGYQTWTEKQNFTAGTSLEVNPVLEESLSATVTSTPILTLTPTPTKKATLTPTPKVTSPVATPSGEILGEQETAAAAFYPLNGASSPTTTEEATTVSQKPIFPATILLAAFVFLFSAAVAVWYTRLR